MHTDLRLCSEVKEIKQLLSDIPLAHASILNKRRRDRNQIYFKIQQYPLSCLVPVCPQFLMKLESKKGSLNSSRDTRSRKPPCGMFPDLDLRKNKSWTNESLNEARDKKTSASGRAPQIHLKKSILVR
eukprot:Gregarina_sp_Poly_1__2332@NODE_1622_length_3688_cov_23_406518_g1069_i0_p2_GENE_NODE_1622_length_3688_cov_23_406518_g1069_i0NODE_1622_length_3688_cov_23_406518_g1069_i0_p2_ORF_typecomplete_len128_score6_20_NODE_1622_length_3688_cov_23_406518_g1069_i027383121